MKKNSLIETSEQIATSLSAIASSQRIAILLAIGNGEACVCHLEAMLGWRQAYISQHLMALRKADILVTNRKGKYIYYKLKNTALLDIIINSASLSGLSSDIVSGFVNQQNYPSCDCPKCVPALIQISST